MEGLFLRLMESVLVERMDSEIAEKVRQALAARDPLQLQLLVLDLGKEGCLTRAMLLSHDLLQFALDVFCPAHLQRLFPGVLNYAELMAAGSTDSGSGSSSSSSTASSSAFPMPAPSPKTKPSGFFGRLAHNFRVSRTDGSARRNSSGSGSGSGSSSSSSSNSSISGSGSLRSTELQLPPKSLIRKFDNSMLMPPPTDAPGWQRSLVVLSILVRSLLDCANGGQLKEHLGDEEKRENVEQWFLLNWLAVSKAEDRLVHAAQLTFASAEEKNTTTALWSHVKDMVALIFLRQLTYAYLNPTNNHTILVKQPRACFVELPLLLGRELEKGNNLVVAQAATLLLSFYPDPSVCSKHLKLRQHFSSVTSFSNVLRSLMITVFDNMAEKSDFDIQSLSFDVIDLLPMLMSESFSANIFSLHAVAFGMIASPSLSDSRLQQSILKLLTREAVPLIAQLERYRREGFGERLARDYVKHSWNLLSILIEKFALQELNPVLVVVKDAVSQLKNDTRSRPSAPSMAMLPTASENRSRCPIFGLLPVTADVVSHQFNIASVLGFLEAGEDDNEQGEASAEEEQEDHADAGEHTDVLRELYANLAEATDPDARIALYYALFDVISAQVSNCCLDVMKRLMAKFGNTEMSERHLFFLILAALCLMCFDDFQDKDGLLEIAGVLMDHASYQAMEMSDDARGVSRLMLLNTIVNLKAVLDMAMQKCLEMNVATFNTFVLVEALLFVATDENFLQVLPSITKLSSTVTPAPSGSSRRVAKLKSALEELRTKFRFFPVASLQKVSDDAEGDEPPRFLRLQTVPSSSSGEDEANSSESSSSSSKSKLSPPVARFLRRYRNDYPLDIHRTPLFSRPKRYELRLRYEDLLTTSYQILGKENAILRRQLPFVQYLDSTSNSNSNDNSNNNAGGEEQQDGYDAGGLTKDWLGKLGSQMMQIGISLGLLKSVSEESLEAQIHPLADFVPDGEDFFRLMGTLIGICLVHADRNYMFSVNLAPTMYAMLLGVPLTMQDMEPSERSFFQNVNRLLDDTYTLDDLTLTMSMDESLPQDMRQAARDIIQSTDADKPLHLKMAVDNIATVEFEESGSDIEVTEDNFGQYLQRRMKYMFGGYGAVKCCSAFIQGFRDLAPLSWTQSLDVASLHSAVEGSTEIDITDWQKYTTVEISDSVDETFKNTIAFKLRVERTQKLFWEIVAEMDPEQRQKLLYFVTGYSRVPAGGFSALAPQFTLQPFLDSSSPVGERNAPLPVGHVCFNTLTIFLFTDKDHFRSKLRQSMEVKQFLVQ